MIKVIQMTKSGYQKLKIENANVKNNLSTQLQRVDNESRQQRLTSYQVQNEHFKNRRKNELNGFDTVR